MNSNIKTFDKNSPLDLKSVEGKFVWLSLDAEDSILPSLCLPHLMREWISPTEVRMRVYYVSLRMLESIMFQYILTQLPCLPSVISSIQHFKVEFTENERKLLKEINDRHCDQQFGSQEDFRNDFLVAESDLSQYLSFLSYCGKKVTRKCPQPADKCGFLRVVGTKVEVAFVLVDGLPFIPLFYLQGQTAAVQARPVSGWDLFYLRFCCNYQGIRDDLLGSGSLLCVSLLDLKKFLPDQTQFQTFWPETNHLRLPQPRCKKYEGSLQPIEDYPNSSHEAYIISSVFVSNKEIPCINSKPFQFSIKLVALEHLVTQLFPRYSDNQVGRILNSLGIVLYKGNIFQRKLMLTSGWVKNNEDIPLVRVTDILARLSDIKLSCF